ncbi:MAG: hypothetical protein MJA31_01940 [Clostridia bacterium]|nr:hypothetical protein [Clostridia bacterium]
MSITRLDSPKEKLGKMVAEQSIKMATEARKVLFQVERMVRKPTYSSVKEH